MNVIVRDDGFHSDEWLEQGGTFIDLEKYGQDLVEKPKDKTALDIPNDVELDTLSAILGAVDMIRIPFPSFADGRGFSLAVGLREIGYTGVIRAYGHILADQYGSARKCGFDEVEIDEDLAKRQPVEQWLAFLPERTPDYQRKWL